MRFFELINYQKLRSRARQFDFFEPVNIFVFLNRALARDILEKMNVLYFISMMDPEERRDCL